MPDLIQVANDLKDMPDQWLAQQMQNPTGSTPPWLVASEVQRREKLRSGAAKAQAPQSSVSQDLIRSLYAKIPPTAGLMPGAQQGNAPTPPGMPPVNLTPGGGSGALGSPPPGTPPANLRMPPRTMAAGGSVDEEEPDDSEEADPYAPAQQPTREQQMAALYPPASTGSADRSAAPPLDEGIEQLVQQAAKNYRIAPEVIRSMIHAESSGQPKAVSGKGARGIMQIMPETAAGMGIKDPAQLDDPAINIDTGSRYLRQLLDKYKDLPTALAAYNAGPGAVDKYKGIPPYPETVGYVNRNLGIINGMRKQLNMGPLEQVPAELHSRLSGFGSPAAPASQLPAQQQEQAPGQGEADTGTSADTTAATPAPPAAPPVAVKPEPLHQVWNQPETAELKSARAAAADFEKTHVPLDQRLRDLYGPDNIALLNQGAKALIGAPPDFSKYQAAIDNVMKISQRQMHPDIGSALMSFGMALMSSRSHNFGVAAGEAGSYALQSMQGLQQQGMKDYMEAAKAGITLQDRIDNYNAKMTQYKMQRLGAQQTGAVQDERTWQTHLATLQKGVATAQSAFDKATTTPAAQQLAAVAILNEEHDPLDPKLNDPAKQVVRDIPNRYPEVLTAGKGTGAPAKPGPVPEQQMDSAVRQTLQLAGRPQPPTDRLATLQDVPLDLHPKANELFNKIAGGRTVESQKAVADLATQSMDPEYIGAYIAQNGHPPPGMSRSPLMVAKVMNIGTDWMKAHGYGAQAAALQQNVIAANKAALVPMTKLVTGVEAFSKTTELNMQLLEKAITKIGDYGAPVMNEPLRAIAERWRGDENISAFHGVLKSVQSEVAKVLSSATASGAITISEKDDIQRILGDDATPGMIRSVLGAWRAEMANRRTAYGQELSDLQQHTIFGHTGATLGDTPPSGQQYRNLHQKGGITIGIGSDNKWHNTATGEVIQ